MWSFVRNEGSINAGRLIPREHLEDEIPEVFHGVFGGNETQLSIQHHSPRFFNHEKKKKEEKGLRARVGTPQHAGESSVMPSTLRRH